MEGPYVLTKSDLAKYPFTPEAAEYVKNLDIKISDLASPEYKSILDRAEQRIEEAVLSRSVMWVSPNDDIEISSFPIAVMMVAATADTDLKRRYALAEAKRISTLLENENKEKIMEIAGNFNWKIKPLEGGNLTTRTYDFILHFTDFLKNATILQDKRWKLVNRLMLNGHVCLSKSEANRLLEEEVRRYVEEKLKIKVEALPQNIAVHVDRLKQLFMQKRGELRLEEMPKDIVVAAFPPCIRTLYDAISSGRHLSHIGRFALTSFLINTGMTTENVVNLFRALSDFDERMTRYQVEHIAGTRGSRTKYIPPRCATLRTHGVCLGMDEICRKIRHPLAYYRRKLKTIKAEPAATEPK